jgi:hypothetical protein
LADHRRKLKRCPGTRTPREQICEGRVPKTHDTRPFLTHSPAHKT